MTRWFQHMYTCTCKHKQLTALIRGPISSSSSRVMSGSNCVVHVHMSNVCMWINSTHILWIHNIPINLPLLVCWRARVHCGCSWMSANPALKKAIKWHINEHTNHRGNPRLLGERWWLLLPKGTASLIIQPSPSELHNIHVLESLREGSVGSIVASSWGLGSWGSNCGRRSLLCGLNFTCARLLSYRNSWASTLKKGRKGSKNKLNSRLSSHSAVATSPVSPVSTRLLFRKKLSITYHSFMQSAGILQTVHSNSIACFHGNTSEHYHAKALPKWLSRKSLSMLSSV